MIQTLVILGRQPALGMAELETLFGHEKLQKIGSESALVAIDPITLPFDRLGGSIKAGKLLDVLETTHWGDIEKYLLQNMPQLASALPEGKVHVGLSSYGLQVKPSRINATGLSLKKAIKATGRSVRIVPNKTADLSSAQVLHNNLHDERSMELLFVKDGNRTYIARTLYVQDINNYAARDQKRPKRDARVGMLPPKLAQIIVNLANPSPQDTVLDPFCGTGVVLQEAAFMGRNVYGTDLEERMIAYSEENMDWAIHRFNLSPISWHLEKADATTHQWPKKFDTIACETYLGRPFSAIPSVDVLRTVMHDVDQIHKKFLQNVARQTAPGFRMCIAVPAWKNKYGFSHLKVLDNLGDLGYTRTVFSHVDSRDLVYHRPDQIVARELVVLIRK